MGNNFFQLTHKAINSIRTRGVSHTTKRIAYWMLGHTKDGGIIKEFENDNMLHLAFYPSGGLGDYIISRVILEYVMQLADCDVTIYVDKLAFAKAIYGDITDKYKLWYEYDVEARYYDLALWVEHFVHVDFIRGQRVRAFSEELAEKCEYVKYKKWKELYIDIPEQWWRERIRFENCKVLGLDRWTELGMQGVFEISTHKVTIPMTPVDELKEDITIFEYPYITINYGSDVMVKDRKQLKLWSKEGYINLIKLIKTEYPKIQVYQLGDAKAEKIPCVDNYILGKDLEYIKHVLKNSLCHIDCEGGLVHLATQFDTKCVVLFGPTPVHMYGYPQNINIVSEYCSNCMGLHEMWAYDCYKGHDSSKCMEAISAERVFKEVKKVVGNEDHKKVN